MKKVIDGKVYNTKTATMIADDHFSDGSNRLGVGRGNSLYVTPKGNFFSFYETCWQGENDSIDLQSIDEAKEIFEDLNGDPDIYEKYFGKTEEG